MKAFIEGFSLGCVLGLAAFGAVVAVFTVVHEALR
jgi:hypothetical protein